MIFRNPARVHFSRLTAVLLVLLLAQITLGILTVLLRKPADIASLHVAVGALTLVTTFVIAVRSGRLFWPNTTAVHRPLPAALAMSPSPTLARSPAF